MSTPTKSIYRKYAHLVQQYFFYLKVSKKNGALRAWQLEIVSSWSTLGSPMALSGPSIRGSIIWTLINSYNIIYKNNIFNLSKKNKIFKKLRLLNLRYTKKNYKHTLQLFSMQFHAINLLNDQLIINVVEHISFNINHKTIIHPFIFHFIMQSILHNLHSNLTHGCHSRHTSLSKWSISRRAIRNNDCGRWINYHFF